MSSGPTTNSIMTVNLDGKNSKLSKKQEIFVNEYVSSGDVGNSALIAGYSKERGYKLLKTPLIIDEINKRTEQAKLDSIASGTDAMLFLTQVMQGKVNDQFGLDPTLRDRLDACKEILKRTKDIELKAEEAAKRGENEFHLSIDWTGNNAPTVKDTINESEILEVNDNEQEE